MPASGRKTWNWKLKLRLPERAGPARTEQGSPFFFVPVPRWPLDRPSDNKDYSSQRYVDLDQITPENVSTGSGRTVRRN